MVWQLHAGCYGVALLLCITWEILCSVFFILSGFFFYRWSSWTKGAIVPWLFRSDRGQFVAWRTLMGNFRDGHFKDQDKAGRIVLKWCTVVTTSFACIGFVASNKLIKKWMVNGRRFRRNLFLNPPIVHFTSCLKIRNENPFLIHPNIRVSKRFMAKNHTRYLGVLRVLHMEEWQ